MNLPFSPTFFRKMDIYQQLKEYEGQKDKKRLWEGEKIVLIWAGSEHHQHLGSAINSDHVKHAFTYCLDADFITKSDKKRLEGNEPYILDCLVTHELAELHDSSIPTQPSVKINRNGILAGQIIIETKNLKETSQYKRWSIQWFLLYGIAFTLLIVQVINGLVELVCKLVSQSLQSFSICSLHFFCYLSTTIFNLFFDF